MKKVILSVVGLMSALTISFGQATNAELAKNEATLSGEGFEWKFENSVTANCGLPKASLPGSNGTWNTFGTAGYSVNFDSASGTHAYPILISSGSQGTGLMSVRIYTGNCDNASAATSIDCSTHKQIQMTVNSNVAVGGFSAMFGVLSAGNWATVDGHASDPRQTVSIPANTDYTFSITSPTHDWTNAAYTLDQVIGLVFAIRDGSDAAIAANITVKSIRIGDASTTAAVSNVQVNNSLISVYPNPAKDQINVDLSSLNTNNATVKIMNANGTLVYEKATAGSNEVINTSSFNKGMYMVQVSSGDKVSNKKIVIE